MVVDRGDGFGRSSNGDAIIIKPQGGLEKSLRVSGQELTKGQSFFQLICLSTFPASVG